MYSCVDCTDPVGRVVRFDPNPVGDNWTAAWGNENGSVQLWLLDWLRVEDL